MKYQIVNNASFYYLALSKEEGKGENEKIPFRQFIMNKIQMTIQSQSVWWIHFSSTVVHWNTQKCPGLQ